MAREVTYDRPQVAKLYVRLEGGEEWEAKPEDLKKFNLDFTYEASYRFQRALAKILMDAGLIEREKDITETRLNLIRYLADLAVTYPELIDNYDQDWTPIAEMERVLREHMPGD